MVKIFSNHFANEQLGFTLVELMISLILGLLISAAVIQIYITNVQTSTIQKSGSELQDASIFGIQQLEAHIRLANLGNPVTKITDNTPQGGIVLANSNIVGLPNTDNTWLPFFTHTAGEQGFTSTSNVSGINSDQLTIQFTNTTGQVMSDCESADINNGETVIERYFLRPASTNTSTGTIKNLVLACDAGRLDNAGIKNYINSDSRSFGTNGQEFITGVDQLKIQLGVEDAAYNLMYLPSSTYKSLTTPHPYIVAVRIGLIVHGSTPVMGSSDKSSFNLFGLTHTLKADPSRKKQVRSTYDSTTLLRNARVIKIAP